MRNIALSLIALGACFTVFTSVPAHAEVTCENGINGEAICFPFEDLGCDNDNEAAIGKYMTDIMGSGVTVKNAKVMDNFKFFGIPLPWIGKPVGDYYLKTTNGNEMEILFEKPITKVSGDGRVILSLFGTPDFRIIGYEDNNEINRFEDDVCIAGNVPFDLCFDTAVNRLAISGRGCLGVAVDNLCVQPVPVPGAGLLGIIGIGVTGWLKRRRTL